MLSNCIVLLSGGQDSTTCLAWAEKYFDNIFTISFDYGQRHKLELEMSQKISSMCDKVIEHAILPVNTFKHLGVSSLLTNQDISEPHSINKNLPSSFVPGRNYIFLGFAAAFAYKENIQNIVTGVCQTDYSGYPDCREETIKSIQNSLSLSMDYNFIIHTPLMWKTKAETVLLMKELGKLNWYRYTHTCYEGVYPPCQICPACLLRIKGFEEAGVEDPLINR